MTDPNSDRTTPSREEAVLDAIAREEAWLAGLEQAQQRTHTRLETLKAELVSLRSQPGPGARLPLLPNMPAPMMSAEKVALYRQRFRGRDDVYSKLWTNTTTGRKGYVPACANEWVRGICEKPRVKCGACLNQAFLPVTDQIILDHLQGRHVVGIYPLLTEETCWLLAADFDKSSWGMEGQWDGIAGALRGC